MGRINYKKLYESRIKEIDIQITFAVRIRDWAKKQRLLEEKKELQTLLQKYQSE